MSDTLSGKPVDCSYTHFYKVVCNGTTNIDMLVIHIFGRRMSIKSCSKNGNGKIYDERKHILQECHEKNKIQTCVIHCGFKFFTHWKSQLILDQERQRLWLLWTERTWCGGTDEVRGFVRRRRIHWVPLGVKILAFLAGMGFSIICIYGSLLRSLDPFYSGEVRYSKYFSMVVNIGDDCMTLPQLQTLAFVSLEKVGWFSTRHWTLLFISSVLDRHI